MIINKKSKRKGFTLIEVVAVMAILAILAAVLMPNVTGYITEARKFEVIEQARKVIIAAETVNIKSLGAIKKDDLIKDIPTKSAGLLTENDITLLNADSKTLGDCYKVVDSKNHTFTLDNENKLGLVTPIPKESITP
ncbi:type II secretion system protein [Clostridium sp.]|uniref:type II secretion system protein n=1 Tax=Clostridium sp. TaxID=1506 RepID=UPI002FCC86DF